MKATIIGASGLVGNRLLHQLLTNPHYTQIQILVRKSQGVVHPKLTEIIVDFQNEVSFSSAILENSVIYSCIGTTNKKVKGNWDLYKSIDFDITINAARLGHAKHCSHFIFVSAIGADKNAANRYLKLKGQIEKNIELQHLPRVFAIRPSLLIGSRLEFRLGEKIAQWVMPFFNFLLPYRYKTITADQVAAKMISLSHSTSMGFQIIEGRPLFEIKNV